MKLNYSIQRPMGHSVIPGRVKLTAGNRSVCLCPLVSLGWLEWLAARAKGWTGWGRPAARPRPGLPLDWAGIGKTNGRGDAAGRVWSADADDAGGENNMPRNT